jgi:hypothetical protein
MFRNNALQMALLPPVEQYRLQLYNFALTERFRNSQQQKISNEICNSSDIHDNIGYGEISNILPRSSLNKMCVATNNPLPNSTATALAEFCPYGRRFALSMSLFQNCGLKPEDPKPQHSYIGLIAMAILSSPESKLVLSDIYQYISDNYPYFRKRGPGWRNSIRHNLSLNDCFIKAGRSANGKGHYWAIHPANMEDQKRRFSAA